MRRTLSRFKTKPDPRPRDVPLSAPSPAPPVSWTPPTSPPSLCSRAYLQSLDSSSRAWVLSSGKTPAQGQTRVRPVVHVVPVAPGEGQIWYNPIPEEEEPVGRGAELCSEHIETTQSAITEDHSGTSTSVSAGLSERVIDKLRSPALKLRRKLSLKSRRDRHGNSSQDASSSNQDVSPQDSSSPSRKRPIRHQLSGCRDHHGNDEELSLRQQVTSHQREETNAQSSTHSLTGVLTVHLQGLDLHTYRVGVSRGVSVVIQVDDVIRGRTAAMTMSGPTLHLEHAFHLPLEGAQNLKVLVLSRVSPDPEVKTCSRTRLCAVGGVCLLSLFTGLQSHELSLDLEPRGSLLLRLSLQAGEEAVGGTQELEGGAPVFGAELRTLVQRETSEKLVPLILQKTVSEINKRGLKVEGIYRLCGSSSVKKHLRDGFEASSSSVNLSACPDLHAISGVLKDYLRELPSPLITHSLYQAIQEVMTSDLCVTPDPVKLLQCLPLVHRETLSFLMDHLSLVASCSDFNKMNAQNLAVCFGPVLFTAVQTDQWERTTILRGGSRPRVDQSVSGVDFKQHIEALHFLLRHWPTVPRHMTEAAVGGASESTLEAVGGARWRWRDKCRLTHRQAGEWSSYQDKATECLEEEPVLDFEAPFNCRLSLKDFDLLIQDFHRQLSKV